MTFHHVENGEPLSSMPTSRLLGLLAAFLALHAVAIGLIVAGYGWHLLAVIGFFLLVGVIAAVESYAVAGLPEPVPVRAVVRISLAIAGVGLVGALVLNAAFRDETAHYQPRPPLARP